MEKIDLRILKTKQSIYEALLLLLKENTFEDVKVSKICEKALVNRSTFYSHFSDKYELLSSFITDMQKNLTEELNKNTVNKTPKEYYMNLIELLLNHIDEQKEIYRAILINNKNSIIVDMFYDTLDKDILKHLEKPNVNKTSVPDEIISKFYSSAVTTVCVEWLKNNHKYSKKDIIQYLDKLIP